MRWLTPPPQRTAYFCSARKPGQRLAGVADPGAGALERVDPVRGRGGDAGEVAGEVERGALGGEQRRGSARRPRSTTSPRRDPVAVGDPVARARRRRPRRRRKTSSATASPATTPSLAGDEVAVAARVGRDRGGAGHVARRRAGPRRARRHVRRARAPGRARRGSSATSAAGRRRTACGRSLPPLMRRSRRGRVAGGARAEGRARRRRRVEHDVDVAGASARRRARGSPRASASRGSPRAARPRRRARRATVSRLVVSQDSLVDDVGAATPASLSSTAPAAVEPVGGAQHARRCAVITSCSVAAAREPRDQAGGARVGAPGRGQRRSSPGSTVGDPAGEDQALEQRVGGQPVGAVHAGAGDLAGGVEARARRRGRAGRCATPPRGVVAGRGDRDQLGDRVDAVAAAGRQDRREPALPDLRAEVRGRRATCAGARSRASGA